MELSPQEFKRTKQNKTTQKIKKKKLKKGKKREKIPNIKTSNSIIRIYTLQNNPSQSVSSRPSFHNYYSKGPDFLLKISTES